MRFDSVPDVERVRWLTNPEPRRLKVDLVNISILGNEATVVLIVNGDRQAAIVPVEVADQSSKTVLTYVVGVVAVPDGEQLVLSMPTSSMGSSTWRLPRSQEDERLLEVS